MAKLPLEEQEAERGMIIDLASKIGATVIKLQGVIDDGGVDGVIMFEGKLKNVEARRKGCPNHSGIVRNKLEDGWETDVLRTGIYVNESTVKNHKDTGFLYAVEINGFKPRVCVITVSMVDELLRQPRKWQRSTNSGVKQPVKSVPLNWFREY